MAAVSKKPMVGVSPETKNRLGKPVVKTKGIFSVTWCVIFFFSGIAGT